VTREPDPAPELLALVRGEAYRIARRIPPGGPSLDDLIGFGHLGLLQAKSAFDPSRKINFEIFARHRIRGAIFDGLRELGCFRRRSYEDLRRQALAHDLLDEPAPDPATGPDRAADASAVGGAITYLATAFLTEATLALHERDEPDAESVLSQGEELARLRAAIDGLDPEDRELLVAVYDLDETGDSGAELARRRGTTRSAVSRRHRQLMERLRRTFGRGP
jgi:RNA polymerase sigma factor for flagellar operon FliA